eukprot:COSAG01_NODE_914_length_12771_cov_47.345802_4_plen_83_part_00
MDVCVGLMVAAAGRPMWHLAHRVKGELHVRVIIEDTSTGDVAEATVWQLDEAAVSGANCGSVAEPSRAQQPALPVLRIMHPI